jgi:sortase A
MSLLKQLEVLLISIGAILLGCCLVAYLDRAVSSHLEFQRFASQRHQIEQQNGTVSNLRQWSQKRVAAYARALTTHVALPLSVVRISRIGLEAPVLDGTGEWTLNRGVGHIEGTVFPGERGNVGIAGHRDGFFRALKDVVVGDTIELDLRDRAEFYRVTSMLVVAPSDVSVLRDHSVPTLTLVTCYPFYFVGNAPKRYVVQAVRIGSSLSNASSSELAAGVSAPGQRLQIPEPPKPTKEMIQ